MTGGPIRFELVRTGRLRQRWHWRIRAANGEILASSEKYLHRADAVAAVELVRAGAARAALAAGD